MPVLTVYFDYKSPYAFLAKDRVYDLARDTGVTVEWRPYVLDIPKFLGSATKAADGTVLQEDRSPHQWRRARYLYMDCRRQARKRGLPLRAPLKIFNSSLAAAGMLFAQGVGDGIGDGVFRRYHDAVFEGFWRRELDLEDQAALSAILAAAGADASAFAAWLPEGLAAVETMRLQAEENGIFGVPTFVLDGEMFWGNEHLPDIHSMLTGASLAGTSASA